MEQAMSRRPGLGLLALALAGAWTVPAFSADTRPILPLEHTVTNPDWSRRPTAEEVMRFYPSLALKLKLSGAVRISCQVGKAGDLRGCAILSEVPAGLGFGAAAVALAGLIRMTPQRVDGELTDGGSVQLPISFAYGADEARAGPGIDVVPAAPSAAALALGKRLAVAVAGENGAHLAVEAYLAGLRTDESGEASEARTLALADLESAEAALAPSRLDALARLYATSLKPGALAAIVTFMESPAGRAWNAATTTLQAAAAAHAPTLAEPVLLEARARLCRQIPCGDQGRASGGAASP
jgi:TonB family protein